MKPRPANPIIIIAQMEGSGTAPTRGTKLLFKMNMSGSLTVKPAGRLKMSATENRGCSGNRRSRSHPKLPRRQRAGCKANTIEAERVAVQKRAELEEAAEAKRKAERKPSQGAT